mmetsp:Transcript_13827/g.23804  ORF Transcript_13827/g.23804 Transcript_13827/m.23804 type:complete len:202 (-) Transcript_13827:2014-2619(-)
MWRRLLRKLTVQSKPWFLIWRLELLRIMQANKLEATMTLGIIVMTPLALLCAASTMKLMTMNPRLHSQLLIAHLILSHPHRPATHRRIETAKVKMMKKKRSRRNEERLQAKTGASVMTKMTKMTKMAKMAMTTMTTTTRRTRRMRKKTKKKMKKMKKMRMRMRMIGTMLLHLRKLILYLTRRGLKWSLTGGVDCCIQIMQS